MGCPVEFNGKLYLLFGDVPSFPGDTNITDADPICYTTDATVNERGIGFTCVRKASGAFRPLTIAGYGALGTVETPTGAFAYGGRLYAFVVRGGDKPYSTLISTADPDLDFTAHYDVSSAKGKFWQIAPWVIRNQDWPGVPSSTGDGLLLWGQRGTSIYLAWMPLFQGQVPPRGIQYYAGRGSWSKNEGSCAALFPTQGTTQLSVTWLAGPRRWICLYTRASVDHPHESVVARIGNDPWSWSEEIVIFNPDRESAWGRYMHLPGGDRLDKAPPNTNPEHVPGYAYSPYLLNRYTEWEARSRTVRLYFLMATFVPYQVVLMKTELTF